MAEKDTIFSSKMKYSGILSFRDFYKFCYDWLKEETRMDPLTEEKYEEKIEADAKKLSIEWVGERELTDYFRFDIKVEFRITNLKKVEVVQGGRKVSMDDGSVEIKLKGILVRDYDAKFESTASKKFMRSVYEKWVIPSRISEFEGKIASDCDEFLGQAKAYLDLEGKR
jgi:hypothetical protein